MANRPTVFICEAEPASIAGVRWFFAESEFEVVGHALSFPIAISAITVLRPNLLLLDYSIGGPSNEHYLPQLAFASETTACVLWGREVREMELIRAFRAGARGYVNKMSPMNVLLDALRRVSEGKSFLEEPVSPLLRQWAARKSVSRLTPREREIVSFVSSGLKNREVAERLGITPATVKAHLMRIFEKTGTRDRVELAARGIQELSEKSTVLAGAQSA